MLIAEQVENESRATLPSKQGTSPEQTTVLEESIYKISGQISTITRNQKYFRTRENRNFATVHSTEGRIVRFSMIQIGLIIAMGALQVVVVRFFFQVSGFCDLATRRAANRRIGRTQGICMIETAFGKHIRVTGRRKVNENLSILGMWEGSWSFRVCL